MRLRTLEISDFRKFDRPVRIDGLEDGINVLDAPNEHGKSTLLAAVKAVLFERHGAKTKAALRMQHHRNATSPVVGMGFELSDGLHRIQKRFMHKEPYARLLLPDGTRLEGDDAEERLQSLLGFAPAGKHGATDDTRGIWGALWVEQCRAEQPSLVEAGRGTLHACLESELGSLTGDNRGGDLLREVRSALSALLDGNGKPKGRLKEIIEEEGRAGIDLAALRSKREALVDDIRELGRLRKNLSVANDADEAERLAADLRGARERRDVVLLHAQALTAAGAERDLALGRRIEAEGEVARRTTRMKTITAAERLVTAAETTETQASGDLREADLALDGLRETARAAEASAFKAAEQFRTSSAVLDLVARASRLGTLQRRLARAETARDQERDVIGEMAAVPADAARLHAVRNATNVLARARSVLDAVATGVEVELDEDAAGRVTASGSVLPAGLTALRAVTDTVIEIAGVGRVRIRPAVKDRARLEAGIASAEAALRAALDAAGAADLEDAEAKALLREALEVRLREARAALVAETAGDAEAGLEEGLQALDDHVVALRGTIAAETVRLGLASLPTAVEAEAARAGAAAAEEDAADALAKARTALVGPETGRVRCLNARASAAAATASARGDLARLRREADAALALEDDATLAARLADLTTAATDASEVLARAEASRPSETIEVMDARIARLEGAEVNGPRPYAISSRTSRSSPPGSRARRGRASRSRSPPPPRQARRCAGSARRCGTRRTSWSCCATPWRRPNAERGSATCSPSSGESPPTYRGCFPAWRSPAATGCR